MPKPTLRTGLFCALLVLLLAALPGRSEAIPPTPIFPNVTGFWSGEFSSVTGLGGLASLNVTDQHRRRFQGSFTLFFPLVPPQPVRILGTASESGEISLVGRNELFMLRAHGQLDEGVMTLDYILDFADGSMDMGTVAISDATIVPGT